MAPEGLRLLSLDGGGVRGLSSLYILRDLMSRVSGDGTIAKPCEYFDMIGGTSTGGLIAIMLGRLEMTVEECITAYKELSSTVFENPKQFMKARTIAGAVFRASVGSKYDADGLKQAIMKILEQAKCPPGSMLKNVNGKCKVFVCALNNVTSEIVCLKSYKTQAYDGRIDTLQIWEACMATSGAISFFPSVEANPSEGQLSDGGLRENNPIWKVWEQAMAAWPDVSNESELTGALTCLVSIGTGRPDFPKDENTAQGVVNRLKKISLDTEEPAEKFATSKPELYRSGRYVRFDVDRGSKGIKLDDMSKLDVIVSATEAYLNTLRVQDSLRACADLLAGRQAPIMQGKSQFHVPFALLGAPAHNKFVDRPKDTKMMDAALLRSPLESSSDTECRVFVLSGMGGIGKTQLAVNFASRNKASFDSIFWLRGNTEVDLRRSFCENAKRIPQLSKYRGQDLSAESSRQQAIDDMLDWLRDEQNQNWLLVFDNIDLDNTQQKDQDKGSYNIESYFPGCGHGAILITSRLRKMEQLGDSAQLGAVDMHTSMKIFQKWNGKEIHESVERLLGPTMLSGLPLAIAQAAIYIKQTGIRISEYIRRYEDAQLWPQVVGASGRHRPLQGYESAVGVTWSLSLEQCRQLEPFGPIAVNLVRLWAFLDNNDLWYGLFKTMVNLPGKWFGSELDKEDLRSMGKQEWIAKWDFPELPEWLLALQNEATFHEAIELLLAYHLIEQQTADADQPNSEVSGPLEGYSMHPVVHKWAQRTQGPEQSKEYSKDAIDIFFTANSIWLDWTLRHRFMAHGKHAIRHYFAIHPMNKTQDDQEHDSVRTCCALVRLGDLYEDTDREQALLVSERAMSSQKLPWKVRSQAAYVMGSLLRDLGKPDAAEKVCQERVRLCTEKTSENHSHRLSAELQLGSIYARQDRIDEARATWIKIVDVVDKTTNPVSAVRRSAFTAMRRLAVSFADEGKVSDAIEWFGRAEATYKNDGSTKWEMRGAVLREQMGSLHMEEKQYDLAKTYFLKAQESAKRTYGPGSSFTEGLKLHIAMACVKLGQFQEALEYLDEVPRHLVDIAELLGFAYHTLGCSVVDEGDTEYLLQDDSSRLVRRTLKATVDILGKDSERSREVYEYMIHLYTLQDRRDVVERLESQWSSGSLEEDDQP